MTQTVVEAAESRSPAQSRELTIRLIGYLIVAAVAFWALFELVTEPTQFAGALVIGVGNGALYALIALGYTLVYGIIELINFSHGDLFMLATVFSALVLIKGFGAESATVLNVLLMILVMGLAMAAAAAVNMTAERVAYRRLRRAPKLAPLITAVGLSFIYQGFAIQNFVNGSAPRPWNKIFGNSGFEISTVRVPWSTVIVLGLTIPLLLGLTYIVQWTRTGKAMRATAQDQDAARLMGIDVDRTISLVFGLGGAMAGAAGMLYLQTIGTTTYNAGFQLGLIAFTAAVLGGIGNLNGAVLGGFLIGIIQGLNDSLGFKQDWSQTVVFTILIGVMVFKPEGLLGKPTTEKV
jgi:branched-chain amino acid transport system permease protein